MKVGLVTQWFPPEPGALVPATIAKGLASRGHSVEVLTGFPNYPNGKLLEGYTLRPYKREAYGTGITVHRSPLYPSHDRSPIRRATNYLSFATSATLIATTIPTPDIWLVYSSPATAAIPPFAQRPRRPVALLIQDLWPDSVTDSEFIRGAPAAAIHRVLNSFASWTYSRAVAVCIISPGMEELLVSRGVDRNKISYTPNWVPDDHLAPNSQPDAATRSRLGLPAGRLFVYAGNIGELQGLDVVVDAFLQVPDANLVLIGDGVTRSRLERRVRESGAANIQFLGHKKTDEIGQYLTASDVQVVSLRPTRLLSVTIPSKLQTGLASARPLMVCAEGDPANVVLRAGAGMAASPTSSEEIVRVIRQFMRMDDSGLAKLGAAARTCYLENYSPGPGVERLTNVLENAAIKEVEP